MLLEHVVPVYRQISRAAISAMLARAVAPIAITGSGPAWQDRTLRELRFRRWGIAQPMNSRISGPWHDRADILGLLHRNVVL